MKKQNPCEREALVKGKGGEGYPFARAGPSTPTSGCSGAGGCWLPTTATIHQVIHCSRQVGVLWAPPPRVLLVHGDDGVDDHAHLIRLLQDFVVVVDDDPAPFVKGLVHLATLPHLLGDCEPTKKVREGGSHRCQAAVHQLVGLSPAVSPDEADDPDLEPLTGQGLSQGRPLCISEVELIPVLQDVVPIQAYNLFRGRCSRTWPFCKGRPGHHVHIGIQRQEALLLRCQWPRREGLQIRISPSGLLCWGLRCRIRSCLL